MNHPWRGLHAHGPRLGFPAEDDIVGTIEDIESRMAHLLLPDGTHGEVAARHLVVHDPAEARRRLEAAGAAEKVDYEAIGRGIAREVFEYMAIQRGTHALGVLDIIGQAIGKGIASARGGGS